MQKDDLDGEIDLKSCVKVSEFDVEKNYGFQIQVRVPWCRRSSDGREHANLTLSVCEFIM